MDVTPDIPEGRQVITGYGDRCFRINGELREGSLLVFPDRVVEWPVVTFEEVTVESLAPVTEAAGEVEVLLLGCGTGMQLVTRRLREPIREAGIVIEPMDTGAACRTYNVLMAEERRVAAALIAV